MSGGLIRANEYDDPDDDTPAERAARVALTRYQRDLHRARTVAEFDAAQHRLDAALDAARSMTTTTTTPAPREAQA